MAENKDELKFKKAYEDDHIDFTSFKEKSSELYKNSRFSLIRELSSESSQNITDIKRATSVKELLSVTPKKKEPDSSNGDNLSTVALKNNRTSSLKSFLDKNKEKPSQPKVSPLTDDLSPHTAKPETRNQNLNKEEIYSQKKDDFSPATVFPDLKGEKKHFSSLFRSSVSAEFRGKKTDSLQELYKRLLNS